MCQSSVTFHFFPPVLLLSICWWQGSPLLACWCQQYPSLLKLLPHWRPPACSRCCTWSVCCDVQRLPRITKPRRPWKTTKLIDKLNPLELAWQSTRDPWDKALSSKSVLRWWMHHCTPYQHGYEHHSSSRQCIEPQHFWWRPLQQTNIATSWLHLQFTTKVDSLTLPGQEETTCPPHLRKSILPLQCSNCLPRPFILPMSFARVSLQRVSSPLGNIQESVCFPFLGTCRLHTVIADSTPKPMNIWVWPEPDSMAVRVDNKRCQKAEGMTTESRNHIKGDWKFRTLKHEATTVRPIATLSHWGIVNRMTKSTNYI